MADFELIKPIELSDTVVTVCSIFIATYISLILSISKYFKFDELKEKIKSLIPDFKVRK